jgi:hypothetical protein
VPVTYRGVVRVTAATPSCVGRVVHVAALRTGVKGARLVCEAHTALCFQWDGAWLWVYSVTGCTSDSSRVESGAWWWPLR